MSGDRCGEGHAHLGITEGVEVSTVEGEGALIGARTTAAPQIVQGHTVGFRPRLCMFKPRADIGKAGIGVDQVAVKRNKPDGDFSAPLLSGCGHGAQNKVAFGIGHPGHAGFFGAHIGQQLCGVGHGVNVLAKPAIQRDMSNQYASGRGLEIGGTKMALNIRDQGAVEVVHRDEHDGEVWGVGGDGALKKPAHHAGGIARLASIYHFDLWAAHVDKGGVCGGGDGFVVLNTPTKNRRVSHDGHPVGVPLGVPLGLGSKPVSICGDAKLMGFSQPLHSVIFEVGINRPTAGRIGTIGGCDTRQSRAHLSQAKQARSKDKPKSGFGRFFRALGAHNRTLSLMAMCMVGLGWFSDAHAAVNIDLSVSVTKGAIASPRLGSITAKLRWLGEDKVIPLAQTTPELWTARVSGQPVRTVGVELWLMDQDPPLRVSQGLELMPKGDVEMSWRLAGDGLGGAWRLTDALSFGALRSQLETTATLWGVWTIFSVLFVLALGFWALRTSPVSPQAPDGSTKDRRGWVAALCWLGFALAWTWPSVLAGPDIVGRHFDALGTVWVIDAVNRFGLNLVDPTPLWAIRSSPVDSWFLLVLSWCAAGVDPAQIHGWIAIVGVASTGFATASLARHLGVDRPFDVASGLLLVCSGLVAAALLEGHVYQVLNPWMPLMALSLHRTGGPQKRVWHGLAAGVFFGLALFSSGYLGLSAAVVALGFGLPILWRGPRDGVVVAAVVAVFMGLVYIFFLSPSAAPALGHSSPESLTLGSLSLSSMGPASDIIDDAQHSWALAVSAMVVALAVVAATARNHLIRVLVVIVLMAVVIAMGPRWALGFGPNTPAIDSPIQFLWDMAWVQYFRFPGRVLWAALLALSVLAGLGITVLSRRLGPKFGWLVMVVVVLETMVAVRLPARQVVRSADTPAVYGQALGPVFDLVGEGLSRGREVNVWMNAILCQYQTVHHRSIIEDCVGVGPANNPRVSLGRWVSARLYANDAEAVRQRLTQMGFESLAVHYDWLDLSDRLRLQSALEGFGVVEEREMAEAVAIYSLEPPAEHADDDRDWGLVGPLHGAIPWRIKVDLIVENVQVLSQFFVEIDDVNIMHLRDGSTTPGAQIGDGVYSAAQVVAVTGPVNLSLVQAEGDKRIELWRGLVAPLDIAEDRLTFRLNDRGQTQPVLRAPDIFSPDIPSGAPKIRAVVWVLGFILMGLWWLGLGRSTAGGGHRGS